MVNEGAAAQRGPRRNLNTVRATEVKGGFLHVSRMKFELIHHRHHFRTGKKRHQVMDEKVAYADRPHAAATVNLFHGAPCAGIDALPRHGFTAGAGPMYQEEIQVTDLQHVHRALEGF